MNTVFQSTKKWFLTFNNYDFVWDHAPSYSASAVQRVRLSLINCIMVVASLYWSSVILSISAMASSKALFASWQAVCGSFLT
jgi:hypothetical protein